MLSEYWWSAGSRVNEAVVADNELHGLRHGIPGASALYWILIALMLAAAVLGIYLKSITGPIVVLLGVVITLTGLDSHTVSAIILAVSIGAAVGIFTGWLVFKAGG